MSFGTIYLLLGAAILLLEGIRLGTKPSVLLTDFSGDLPIQSKITLQSMAGGAPLSTSLVLVCGLVVGINNTILLAYLTIVLAVVAIIRLVATLGKANMQKQYVAVVVEFVAAALAATLAYA